MTNHTFIKVFLQFVFFSAVGILHSQTLLTASLNSPGNAGTLSENCSGPYELVLRRGPDNDSSTTIFISGSGMAQIGVDYRFPNGAFPVEWAPDDSVAIIPIIVTNDGMIEGTESVLLEIAFLSGSESGFINFETAIVDAYEVEIQSASDTIEWCRGVPYVLLATSNTEEIFWTPAEAFDDSVGTAATLRPVDSGWYYANVGTDDCGATDSIYFNLAIVEILNADTVFICNDANGVVLQGSLEGLAIDFTWIPADSTLSNPNILNPVANPTITTTYFLQSDIGICIAMDKVVVRVDSLPADLHIDIAPMKPYYCAGEIVALFSPSFDTISFPDITFMWAPDNGTFTSELTLLNAALILQDTTLYIRENVNNACRSSDSILINVVPSGVPLSVTDTMLCPGEMFTVTVLSDQVTEPEWTPKEGLSCTKCLSPKVTVLGTPGSSLLYEFSGMILECPVGATLSIQIPPIQVLNIGGDRLVCAGDIIPLTITNPGGFDGFEWTVEEGDVSLSCTNCPNPIVTINSINGPITLTVSADALTADFCGAFGTVVFTKGGTEEINISGDSLVCDGDMVTLNISNQAGLSNFNWEVTSGIASLSCDNCPNPTVNIGEINETITLTVTATSTNGDFCDAFGTFVFTKGSTNQIIGPTFMACLGDMVTISTGDPSVFDVQWSVLSGDLTLSCTNCESPVVTVNSAVNQLRFLGNTTNPNFCNVSGTVTVNTFPEDLPSDLLIQPDPFGTPIGQGTSVTATLATSPSPSSIMWSVNGNAIVGTGNSIQFNADGEVNLVEAKFINSKGCEQIASISFTTVPPSYMIPNAFTPNNDMLNEKFRIIVNGNIVVEQFLIFNRWGQLVYEAADDDLEGWDGLFKNEPAASDTYVYTAQIRFPDGRLEIAKGDIALLR